ncbi:MAG: dipeptide epimerase, partial [Alphaproteobacteria bacterium]
MNDPNRKAAARGVGQPRSARRLGVARESLRLKAPFRITGRTFTTVDVIVVTLEENGGTGRGEAAGVYYLVSDPDEMIAQVDFVRSEIESGATREDLQHLLPCGGARNALDCAMWDLDSALSGKPAWALAGLTALKPLVTTFTLGAGSEEETASGARACEHARALKLKLTGGAEDAGRVRAARHARPDV